MKSKIRLSLQIIIIGIITWVIFAGWDIEAFCPFGGILSFGTQLYQNTLACSMSAVAIFMAFALFIGALAIGKLFCGYLCPIGSISEWFGKLGKKMHLHFLLPKFLDRFFRIFKYGLLFAALYYTVTSSELFCKKFDPYYGVASGFDHDVVLWWSIAAIAIVVFGSILFKQFWCKYLCPLGAISNMFVNIYLILIPFGIFIILRLLNVDISIAWLFGALAVIGYAWEAGWFKFIPLPLTKITIDQDKCTHCLACVKACPYGIKVDTYEKVDHPDCVICNECYYACKDEQAIGINKSRKLAWLPPAIVVILPLLGFLLSTQYEFRTLEKRWGNFDQVEQIAKYHQSGIKNVKCWGTSFALYKKIKDKPGICGLDTYAKSHSITVYYDPSKINEIDVKKAIFNPKRYKVRNFRTYQPDSLAIWEVGIENFFDLVDNMNLIRILRNDPHVFGFETNYGEPVIARIFYCSDSTQSSEIRKLIDETKVIESVIRKKKHIYEMDFLCENEGEYLGKVSRNFYILSMFGAYNQQFNGYQDRDISQLDIYEIGMPRAENFMLRRQLPYLVSHISEDSSVVRFTTSFTNNRRVAQVFFDPAQMDTATIHHLLVADTLRYFKSDDTRGAKRNIFEFEYPSRIIKAADFVDPVRQAKAKKLGKDVE